MPAHIPITIPSGGEIGGASPIVIIGANGSGKTRQSRTISAREPIEFVNALRNTRVAPELQAMGVDTARTNFTNQKAQSQGQPWELASEFDYMLSQLLAQYSAAAIDFQNRVEADVTVAAAGPALTPLKQIERLWSAVFPGRRLEWRDWKPWVVSETTGTTIEYSANQMSDGEKAALYLAGRVFSFDGGVLVIDEPETHFHSLLAVRIWNALEDARPDVRFVYVTHDLTFALSRRDPTFVLASPTGGLKVVAVGTDLPDEVAGALLGSASLSFYASRVVFCEGSEGSLDSLLYNAWFSGQDTVVRPVGGCQNVLRCVGALSHSGIATALTSVGIVDGDFHPDAFLAALPQGVHALGVHEVESLFALPEVIGAVCSHLGRTFDRTAYAASLSSCVDEGQQRLIAVQRWKARIEPHLASLVATVSGGTRLIADLTQDLPALFDVAGWGFDPAALLSEEDSRVRAVSRSKDVAQVLRLAPGKQMLPRAARTAGLDPKVYVELVVGALRGLDSKLATLGADLEFVLSSHLPARFVQTAGLPASI